MRNKVMPKDDKIVDIKVHIKHETEKAILVDDLKGKPVWLPKSQVEIHPDGEISLPEWLAIGKGLV